MLRRLLMWWENSFERGAARQTLRGHASDGVARGEFISTLIIDHGAAGRPDDGRSSSKTPRPVSSACFKIFNLR